MMQGEINVENSKAPRFEQLTQDTIKFVEELERVAQAPVSLINTRFPGNPTEQVFFWAEEHRLHGLLGARDYRNLEHDVLTIDSAPSVREYANNIWLCHMNSGNTWPMLHARGIDIFKRIADYPANTRKPTPDSGYTFERSAPRSVVHAALAHGIHTCTIYWSDFFTCGNDDGSGRFCDAVVIARRRILRR